MQIKDLYEYAWTHCQVSLNTEDSDYLLCFVLDKMQHNSRETIGILQRAIERKRLVEILNMLVIRLADEGQITDWIEHLVPDSAETYRHLQTELDQMILEPERISPEFYNIPAWLCHPAVFDRTSGPLSEFQLPSRPWYIRCVRRTSYQPSDTDADEPTSVTQESDSASAAD